MKENMFYLTILIMLVLLTMLLPDARAKEIDLSITLSGVYDRGNWKSGMYENVTGKLKEDGIFFVPSGQIKFTRWRLQPTVEFNFRHEGYNFSNWEQHAHVREDNYTLLAGATYDFGFFSGYLLAGVTHVEMEATLAEVLPYPMENHGTTEMDKNLFTVKLGGYRLWKIGPVRVGPEIAVQGLVGKVGFDRCRKFRTNRLLPFFGVRVHY